MNDVVICLLVSAGFDKAAQGLAGAGRRLADEPGGRLHALVIGACADTLALEVARLCDTVVVVDQAELAEYQPETCLSALARLCADLSPRAVLLAGDTYSQEIAPRLAYRLGGSAVGDGVEVRVEGNALRVSRQVYGGKAQAVVELKRVRSYGCALARSPPPRPEPKRARSLAPHWTFKRTRARASSSASARSTARLGSRMRR